MRNVEFSGVLVPNHTVNIFAKMAGQATTVTADVGNTVKAGQLLVQIDTKELNAQLAVAEAAAEGVGDQAVQVKSGMETARLNLEMAQRSYERTKTLLDTKVVTQSQLDDAQTKLDLAKTAYDNASRQYQTVSGSGLAQAEAQVNFIKVQISNSTITSPIGGIVTNRNINPGEITSDEHAAVHRRGRGDAQAPGQRVPGGRGAHRGGRQGERGRWMRCRRTATRAGSSRSGPSRRQRVSISPWW